MCSVHTWLRGLQKMHRNRTNGLRLFYRGQSAHRVREVWQTEWAIKNQKDKLKTVHTKKKKKNRTCGNAETTRKEEATRGKGILQRPIVSDASTVVMMHCAAGPVVSLKLYEASLARILLQWRHCLAHFSLAADVLVLVEGVAWKQAQQERETCEKVEPYF